MPGKVDFFNLKNGGKICAKKREIMGKLAGKMAGKMAGKNGGKILYEKI
jgi:hypothetical protein